MRAIVWRENGRLERTDVWPEPAVGEREVLVRVRAAGVCATDLHMVSGRLRFASPPWVLGHELAGTVERVGSEVAGWRVGDRVVVDPVVGCGQCPMCQSGRKHHCPAGGELGTTLPGGGYGEFVVARPGNLYRLPDTLTYAEGAMMEPLNCTLGAIERVCGLAGSRVAVFGAGPAGLLFAQLAQAYGASMVTAIDRREEPLALARRLGADEIALAAAAAGTGTTGAETIGAETIGAGTTGMKELFAGRPPFEVTIEASGSEAGVRACIEHVAPGGTVVLYGLHGAGVPTIDSDRIVAKDLTVVTCTSAPLLWEKGIRLVEAGKVNVRDIVSLRVPFGEAEEVLNGLVSGTRRTIKAMLTEELTS
ncbi:zinc-dependent alcohol dehydrogenase [Cohnella fermenti]|uniref:Enoyl reductase (ER) domain-containing protein n=1 Tax=Cohnella fermenti TaxID=2565925 RepID=A0A4S4BSC3_9BACL|nr:alcohol dehydrogenase catalytic domain-containing protein [Cohnella fermenti]THF77126.1 hypothetical protein E6C55_17335 [Cohnella fermenti]